MLGCSDSLARCSSPSTSATRRPRSCLYRGGRARRPLAARHRALEHRRRARRPPRRAARLRERRRASASPRRCRCSSASGRALAAKWAHAPLLVVGPGVKTGIPIRYDDPREVGPDRIVNSVAAKARYGAPVIVVDFGTSTNFDVVSPEGEYVGGVLAPGIEISMDALFARAARLVKVDYTAPPSVIGKTTVAGLQSGLVYGFAGQVDGIVGRIRGELGVDAPADRDRRPRRPRRAALGDDRARRPVPDARGPAARLGAERVIPDPPAIGVFVVAALALLLVPGPAVLYVVARSIQEGRRAGLVSVLGIHVGTLAHIAAATLGLSALVVSSAVAFTAVKIAGAVYLVGLGLWTLFSRQRRAGRRARRRAEPAPRVRAGDRGQRPQPEDRALLPRVPAAVRRPERAAPGGPDRVPRRALRAARPRHRLAVGARSRHGRRDAAALAPFRAHAALRHGHGVRRARRRDSVRRRLRARTSRRRRSRRGARA